MNDIMAPWLVRAKASPPRKSKTAIPRDSLLRALAERADCLVTVLEAPAGFGKTTLLAQWRESLLAKERIVAWLTVDESDDPDVLLPYLGLALQLAGVDMTETGLLNPTFHGDRLSNWRGRLLNRVEESGQPCVLILDDLERASLDAVRLVLEPILHNCPRNLQVIMAFRRNPGIALSQYAVANELNVLHPQDLKFGADEVRSWLDTSDDEGAVQEWLERTDGWPVSLQLFRGGLLNDENWTPEHARAAEDYVEEQVLAQLEPSEAEFLGDVALLETVNLECADAMREASDSAALAQVIHSRLEGLFSPLEHAENEYRLHPLIRDQLRERMPILDGRRTAALHSRAARWMAEAGHPLKAIAHAVAGEDVSFAAEVLEIMGGAQLFLREGLSRLRSALASLQGYELESNPRIHIARAALLAKDGNMQAAREAMKFARAISDGFEKDRPGGSRRDLKVDGHLVELLLSEYGCSPSADMLTEASFQEVENLTRSDPPLSALILTWRCLFSAQMGFLDRAFLFGRRAIDEFRKGGSTYGELFIYLHYGQAEMARARCRSAVVEYGKAQRLARQDFPGDLGVRRICNIALGEVHWESGDYAAAQTHLRNVSKQVRHPEAWFDILMAAYRCSVEFLNESEGLKRAELYLEEVREHTEHQSLGRLTQFINALHFLLLARSADAVEALAFAQRFGSDFSLHPLPSDLRTWRELEIAVQAVSKLAQLEHAPGRAHRFIMDTLQFAQSRGIWRLAVHCEIQSACLYVLENDTANGLVSLTKALRWAAGERCSRPFLTEREVLQPLLSAIAEREEGGGAVGTQIPYEAREFARALLKPDGSRRGSSGFSSFSVREAEIIRHLSSGQPDKLIARSVGLSAHGVRYHLKNIYAKLGVQNRTQAINKAQTMGLLGP